MPAFDKIKSKIKLIIYIPQENGRDVSMTFYCFLKENKFPDSKIIVGMKRRISKHLLRTYRMGIFYNNYTKVEIERFEGNLSASKYEYCSKLSKIKMVAYVPDVSAQDNKDILYSRYSPLHLNNNPVDEIIKFMYNTIALRVYKGQFRTLLFYDNHSKNRKSKPISKKFGNFYQHETI
jgi:hypothetical protein